MAASRQLWVSRGRSSTSSALSAVPSQVSPKAAPFANYGGTLLTISYAGGDGNDVFINTVAGQAGDFDFDGDVDGRDFLVWQRGGSATPLSATDLADWQANYGAGALSANVAVPEPASAVLLIVGCLAIPRRRANVSKTTNR